MEKKREHYEHSIGQIQQTIRSTMAPEKIKSVYVKHVINEDNRERASEQRRHHYAENRDLLRKQKEYTQRTHELQQPILKRECGFDCQKQSMRYHLKSKRHGMGLKPNAEEHPQAFYSKRKLYIYMYKRSAKSSAL